MDMLLTIIVSLGAICACFNVYFAIVGDKSDKTMKQTEEIIVKKKDGTVLDFNLTQIQIGTKQKTIIELKED